jgi:methylmalonyl-CoA/ethylmalonyl-CoA epimerase
VTPGDAAVPGTTLLRALDHVGIAVHDLDAAVTYYTRTYGATVAHRERIERDGVEEALIAVSDSFVQLLSPTRPDSPVARFLERHGEGIHHVGYRVDDCAEAVAAVRAAGGTLIDEEPRPGSRGTTVAFVHPKGAFGTLVELVEEPR